MSTEKNDMKIKVSRNNGNFAIFRNIKLYIDDNYINKIKRGESMIIDIPLDAKKIHGRMDLKNSPVLSLENIKEDEEINIESNFSWIFIIAFPFSYIFFPLPIRIKKQKKQEEKKQEEKRVYDHSLLWFSLSTVVVSVGLVLLLSNVLNG
jgi:hypothetical protein